MNPIQTFREKLQTMHARAFAFNKLGLAASRSYYQVTDPADGKVKPLDQVFAMALQASDQELMASFDATKKLINEFRNGSAEAADALNELRQTNIELYVKAMSNFGLFFSAVTLKDNEQSCYVHTYKNPVNVKHIAQDGHVGTMKLVKAQKPVFVDMREISAEVGYQIRDVNLGMNIVEAANATVDVAWDIENKIDYEKFKFLINGAVFAPFKIGTPGSETALDSTFIPHWRIAQSNLPTTNSIDLGDADTVAHLNAASNGTSTDESNRFRFDVIVAAIDYCARWGKIFGTPVEPTGAILIPSIDVSALATEIKPTTLFFNEVASGVLQDYRMFEYLNKKWVLIPDVTLESGCCYVVLNKPVGEFITKPSLDWEDVETNKRKNWETRMSNKTMQLYVPEPSRVNALRVIYSSTYSDPTLN